MTVKAAAHFVDCDIKPASGEWSSVGTGSDALVSYPTLHELDASEIPTKPTAPTVDDGTTTVSDANELQAMSGATAYILDADIDLTGVSWTPIVGFTGTLDGDGYTISNLSSTNGIFASTGSGSKFKDLTLDGFSIDGGASDNVGCLVGDVSAGNITILNVDITNSTVTSTGHNLSTMLGNVTIGTGNVKIDSCTISACSVTGGSASDFIGHYIGFAQSPDASADNCQITDCTVTGGSIYGNEELGGFVGDIYNSGATGLFNIHTCTTSSSVQATVDSITCTGGFIGAGNALRITSCSASGGISVDADISSMNFCGGFLGYDSGSGSQFTNCSTSSAISFNQPSTFHTTTTTGGFVGMCAPAGDAVKYLRCSTTSTITINSGTSGNYIGGFVGEVNSDDTTRLTFERCEAHGDVSIVYGATSKWFGGFCGGMYLEDGLVTDYVRFQDCYSWGKVTTGSGTWRANEQQGGFIGKKTEGASLATGFEFTIDNCYCAQTVDRFGSTSITDGITPDATGTGGFGGDFTGTKCTEVQTNCFFDKETCGFETDFSDASGEVTSVMMTKTTYTDAGWAFSTVDGVKDDINSIWTIVKDSAVSGTGPQYRTVASPQNWDHLEGEIVQVLKNGTYIGDEAVSGGQITLDD